MCKKYHNVLSILFSQSLISISCFYVCSALTTWWSQKRVSWRLWTSPKMGSSATLTRGWSSHMPLKSLIGKFWLNFAWIGFIHDQLNVHNALGCWSFCKFGYEILDIFLREVAIALSPSLAENEMRIVLSWETSQDLDIYALQMDKYLGINFTLFLLKNWLSRDEIPQRKNTTSMLYNRATGDIVCKTYWLNMDGCEGIVLDVDSR